MTQNDFPFLYGNRKGNVRGQPTFGKLIKLSMRKIMVFVVRLHYAVHVLNVVETNPKVFNFQTFPELKNVLLQVEWELKHCIVPKVEEGNALIAKRGKAGKKRKRKQGDVEITQEHRDRAKAAGGIWALRLRIDVVRNDTERALIDLKHSTDTTIQRIQHEMASLESAFVEFVDETASDSAKKDLEYIEKRRKSFM